MTIVIRRFAVFGAALLASTLGLRATDITVPPGSYTAATSPSTNPTIVENDSGGITAGAVTVGPNAYVTFKAGTFIKLNPGFSANAMGGGIFSAIVISSGEPLITSGATASGSVGASFSYQITATNSPTGYAASGLPPGVAVNSSSGAISGTPTTAGTYTSTVSATNASGTGTQQVTITISAGGGGNSQATVAIIPSSTVSCTVGQIVTFSASGGSGMGAFTWGGQASGTGTLNSVTFSNAGSFTVTVYRAGDSTYARSNTATVNVTVNSTGGDPNNTNQLKLLVPTP